MKKLFFTVLVGFTIACTGGPEPIYFGEQACHYCKMTIVDKQHAAQAISNKGKVYNFDAIECMVNLELSEDLELHEFRVCNYEDPGMLISVDTSFFLISKNIPSPMGAFLSAFGSKEMAMAKSSSNEDIILNWEQLKGRFKSYLPDPVN